jgi:drug/metabolite transporter (DMT)-like permease
MVAVFWALASMLCAALNDLLFKHFTRGHGSIGLYVVVIGFVWSVFFFIAGGAQWTLPGLDETLFWRYSLLSGLLSAAANILLIECMSRNGVGICASIYRLNLIPAALIGIFFLGESMDGLKLLGIFLAAVAVLLFLREEARLVLQKVPGASISRFTLIILIIAASLRGGMGITYKLGMEAGADVNLFLMVNGWVWGISGFGYYWFKRKQTKILRPLRTLILGIISGLLVCGIVLFLAMGLRAGDASVVLPIAQLSFIVTSLAGVIWLKESLGLNKLLGLCFATISILCMILLSSA